MGLPDRVAQWYYSHGLFCSSHPIITISLSIICFLLCCYPLLNIPLPGSIPTKVVLPYNNVEVSTINLPVNLSSTFNSSIDNNYKADANDGSNNTVNLSQLMNETAHLPHIWAKDAPLVYIQQIIFKTGVWPWREELKLGDAFRAPLRESFRLLETVRNHQQSETGASLSHICFHVENVKRNAGSHKILPILPEYSCLVLSPANLWQQNLERFSLDNNVLATVFNQQNLQKGKVSMAEMVFGMHLKDTGIKRYPLRARPRALQYAITLFFNQLNEGYIDSLKEKLSLVYPMHHKWDQSVPMNEITLIYYPGEFNYHEFVPLCISFGGVFLYIYFSVRKIEFVKSKVGLAISAVISVAASLVMSIGFCFFFGLTLSFQGKEIFPYLVILVGLENVFVLTKSVMSIDSNLDVKIRLAQGLSKEGWSITKNLLTEITILTISLFTFVPIIQQFSIFMIVNLLCDFFLQMIFFTTVLGIDIRREEMSREKSSGFQFRGLFNTGFGKNPNNEFNEYYGAGSRDIDCQSSTCLQTSCKLLRSKSHPRLNGLAHQPHTNVIAGNYHNIKTTAGNADSKVPKRIRLVNIWARTRFFQRAFMVWMVVWISMIIYSSGIVENIFEFSSIPGDSKHKPETHASSFPHDGNIQKSNGESFKSVHESKNEKNQRPETHQSIFNIQNSLDSGHSFSNLTSKNETYLDPGDIENMEFNSEILNKTLQFISLKHLSYPQPWRRLSEFHWSSVLAQYNVSVAGRYVALLPPLLVKHRVTPEAAAAARHPNERGRPTPPSRWQALAAALDPLDFTDFEIEDGIHIPHVPLQSNWGISQSSSELPYYPTSPMELLLLSILCAISVIVIAYTMVVLYRCICTRNYAEWRTSWTDYDGEKIGRQAALQIVMEAVPTVVTGHSQEVECLVTDGDSVVSSCLQGQLKVWDPSTGDLTSNIDRKMFFGLQSNICERLHGQNSIKSNQQTLNFEPDPTPPLPEVPDTKNDVFLRKRFSFKPFNKDYPRNLTLNNPLKKGDWNFKESSNKPGHSEDWQGTNFISAKDKTKYEFAMQYRKLFEDTSGHDGKTEYCDSDISSSRPLEQYLTYTNSRTDTCSSFNTDCRVDAIDKNDLYFSNMNDDYIQSTSSNNSYDENPTDNVYFSTYKENDSLKQAYQEESVINNSDDSNMASYEIHKRLSNVNLANISQDDNSSSKLNVQSTSCNNLYSSVGKVYPPAIWCMDLVDNLIVIGCSDGRLEFWEASTGKFKCIFDDGCGSSISHVQLVEGKMAGRVRLAAARLSGHLDLLQLEGPPPSHNPYKRTHIRTGSAGSIVMGDPLHNRFSHKSHNSPGYSPRSACMLGQNYNMNFCSGESGDIGEQFRCIRLTMTRAHRQPITVLECDSGRILTGSQDHTLKVFSTDNLTALYTLHGHCGPITCVFIDRFSPMVSGSGSQDGLLCVWDLMTGACVYSIQAHDGPISGIAYTTSYVMSMGADERLCIWDRFRGHLLNAVHVGQGAGGCGMLAVTHCLVVTGGRGGLILWDASTGQAVRRVLLGPSDGCVFVRQILPLKDAIVCDYGNQLRIVRFPLVKKIDANDIKSK